MSSQPFLIGSPSGFWIPVRDGNDSARSLFERHYSRHKSREIRKPKLFVGPGDKMVLLTQDCSAMFVWRKFIDDSGQTGINCAVFRNESPEQFKSSDLIREADAIANERWPNERHYTYVDPSKVASRNPGYCFLMAGWERCGVTKSGKLIFAREPQCAK